VKKEDSGTETDKDFKPDSMQCGLVETFNKVTNKYEVKKENGKVIFCGLFLSSLDNCKDKGL
jgi:adenosine deaminase